MRSKMIAPGLTLLSVSFVLALSAWAFSGSLHGQDKEFRMNADNSVIVDGLYFENMKEYLKSDYLKTSGRRCGSAGRYKRLASRGGPLGAQSDCSLAKTVIKNEYYPSQALVIPILFHVIYKSDGTGNISDAAIADQIRVLNEDFRAMAGTLGSEGHDVMIQFQLVETTRTQNNNWFQDQDELAFKSALGRDPSRFFNIYSNTASGYLGYSTMPQESAGDVYDGIVINYETVGGRDNGLPDYDQGRTLVHETGHYLGLLHTFDGEGCFEGYEAGDLIADTESENVDHYTCVQTYTCNTPDPIHNYMNYTNDLCMKEFTREQSNRMACSLINYRPALYTVQSESIVITSPNGGETWQAGSTHNITWSSVSARFGASAAGNVRVQYSLNNGAAWVSISSSTPNDGSYSWTLPAGVNSSQCIVRVKDAADGIPSDISDAVFSIVSGGIGTLALNRSSLFYASSSGVATTPPQEILLNVSGGVPVWSAQTNQTWLTVSPTSGAGAGLLSVAVNPSGLAAGQYYGTMTVSSANASNSPRTVSIVLIVRNAFDDRPPFGEFSTPIDGVTGVSGSLPVTGWVLDDVGVQSVKIYRSSPQGDVFIGDGVFTPDARPDVEEAYPSYPQSYRGGWGYMLLTNTLPGGGNGVFTLKAVAADLAGKTKVLGTARITCANAAAAKPFGALESPSQGGTVTGNKYYNWGWALTPQPAAIPVNGSSITVYVDGKALGHPVYNLFRQDVAALFPGYANSNGAFGYYILDTTKYSNGMHAIQWVVSDDRGRQDGVGSRYFHVFNPTAGSNGSSEAFLQPGFFTRGVQPDIIPAPAYRRITVGMDAETERLDPDAEGVIRVRIHELENLELHLAAPGYVFSSRNITNIADHTGEVSGQRYLGCLTVSGVCRPLPVGASFDAEHGILYWTTGVGFTGDYRFVFFDKEANARRFVTVTIIPRHAER